MAETSASRSGTYPGQRQQFVQRLHLYHTADVDGDTASIGNDMVNGPS